jgi:hypothetical protein
MDRTDSSSPTAREIDREIGTVGGPLGGTPMCGYLRYNVLLRSDWCKTHLGENRRPEDLKALQAMDEPANIAELDRVGRLAGQRLVKAEHFGADFDPR